MLAEALEGCHAGRGALHTGVVNDNVPECLRWIDQLQIRQAGSQGLPTSLAWPMRADVDLYIILLSALLFCKPSA